MDFIVKVYDVDASPSADYYIEGVVELSCEPK